MGDVKNLDEIMKLHEMLEKANIPHEYSDRSDGKFISYPQHQNFICDACCFTGSYGYEAGLIEIMGLLTPEEYENDDVVGWLDAENVFNRIKNDWENRKENKNVSIDSRKDNI